MGKNMIRHYRLAYKMSELFNSGKEIDTTLSISMYNLNQYMDSERSSVFLIQPSKEHLSIFSSFDLEKHEIRIPKSVGVAGWVFEHRKPAVVHNAYADSRFNREVDDMTGFHTRNLICTPLFDCKDKCIGALQSLNKKSGDFTTDDLEFLELAARIVAVAIGNSRLLSEKVITDEARKRLINQIIQNIGKVSDERDSWPSKSDSFLK